MTRAHAWSRLGFFAGKPGSGTRIDHDVATG
jgi:hypothetical protein